MEGDPAEFPAQHAHNLGAHRFDSAGIGGRGAVLDITKQNAVFGLDQFGQFVLVQHQHRAHQVVGNIFVKFDGVDGERSRFLTCQVVGGESVVETQARSNTGDGAFADLLGGFGERVVHGELARHRGHVGFDFLKFRHTLRNTFLKRQ